MRPIGFISAMFLFLLPAVSALADDSAYKLINAGGDGNTPAPAESAKTCPQTRYIDCMPPITEQKRPMCSKEYLEWVKEHCPGVEVVY